MTRRTLRAVAALIAIVLAQASGTPLAGMGSSHIDEDLVVHEWGTFTSIAGKKGVSVEWRPLAGASDLPGFVYTSNDRTTGQGLRSGQPCTKCNLEALVRMETPVIYFYTGRETAVSVRVEFPTGRITEWYPRARLVYGGADSGSIDWGQFTIVPGAQPQLPIEKRQSHYYPARETDAAAVRVCGKSRTEYEKFLFYRGVGNFDLPIAVTLEGEKVLLRNLGRVSLGSIFLFENRDGRVGYTTSKLLEGDTAIDRPALVGTVDSVQHDLEKTLMQNGLYAKEARAMLQTWRDSWFEEGMRVFYVLPRSVTDAILPLSIDPRPSELVRVLVGRTEIITPEMEQRVSEQVTRLGSASSEVREQAIREIRKYGRFSEPVLKLVRQNTADQKTRSRIDELLKASS